MNNGSQKSQEDQYESEKATPVKRTWSDISTLTKSLVVGGAVAVVAPLAIIPVLGAVGFTAGGVAAGSIAASLQTTTTVSGSMFALCQSAGAVGAVAASTSAAVGVSAGTAAGGVTALVCKLTRKKRDQSATTGGEPSADNPPDDDEEEEEEEDPTNHSLKKDCTDTLNMLGDVHCTDLQSAIQEAAASGQPSPSGSKILVQL